MTQWVRALAAKPDDLKSFSRILMERTDSSRCHLTSTYSVISPYIQKVRERQKWSWMTGRGGRQF